MGEGNRVHRRRAFFWSNEARELITDYKRQTILGTGGDESNRRILVTRLAEITGNPRDACIRFLQDSGVHQKRRYREWTKPEQQRLLDLITSMPVEGVARVLGRPSGSVRSMLHRLGLGGKTGREWFTKYSLSRALHTRQCEIQRWIDRGWLKSRALPIAGIRTSIIDPDDFCAFVKEHGHAAVTRRLSYDALRFVQNYVFPPSHSDLLSVRGPYKKSSENGPPTRVLDEELDCEDRSGSG